LLLAELEHEVLGEAVDVALHRLNEGAGFYLIELGQVGA